jgi:NADPH2:quinone reductase
MRGLITDPEAPGGLRLADDLPEPVPAANEAVIEVVAYAINPGESTLIRLRPNGFRPGQDVAGRIAQAALDGSGPAAGSRVVAYPEWEGWAERIAVPTSAIATLDDTVEFEQAATLPVSGLTALRALRLGGAVLGRRVLITGATGGVGQLAIQLAVASGAHVTAQVSAEPRAGEAKELGAHEVVTSLDQGTLAPFDHILEGVGGPLTTQAVRLLKPGAAVVLYGGGKPEKATLSLADFYGPGAHNARIIGFISTEPDATKGEDLGILATLVASGVLTPRIGWRGDWTQTADAFEALAARSFRGKAVLTLG